MFVRQKPVLLTLLCTALCCMFLPRPAMACSEPDWCLDGYLLPAETAPANLSAGYWVPRMYYGDQLPEVDELAFELHRVDGEEEVVVAFGLEGSNWRNRVLWRPEEPLEEGATYRVRGTHTCTYPGEEEPAQESLEHFFVASDPAPLPTRLGILEIDDEFKGELEVSTNSGSCYSIIGADQIEIAIRPDDDVLPWWDLLVFSTYINGESWYPARELDEIRPMGQSWWGRGRDLLFASCHANDGLAIRGLDEGTHRVEMRASLPGTDIILVTNSVDVTLNCDGVRAPFYGQGLLQGLIYPGSLLGILFAILLAGAVGLRGWWSRRCLRNA